MLRRARQVLAATRSPAHVFLESASARDIFLAFFANFFSRLAETIDVSYLDIAGLIGTLEPFAPCKRGILLEG